MSKPKKGEVPANFQNSKRHRCPACLHESTAVIDKRNKRGEYPEADYSSRRRQCKGCGHRWSTVEIHQKFYDLIKKLTRKAEQSVEKKQKAVARSESRAAKNSKRDQLRSAIRKIEGRDK